MIKNSTSTFQILWNIKAEVYKTKDEAPRLLRSPTSYNLSWRNASTGMEMPGDGAWVGRGWQVFGKYTV